MHWRRWVMIGLILAAVIAAVAYGFRPQPLLVETEQVRRGPLRVAVEEEGKTRVRDRYVVSAPIAGYARRIALDVGDAIVAGQTVTSLEPLRAPALDPRASAQAQARVAAAEASLKETREKLRAAAPDVSYWESQQARVRDLNKTGDIAREVYDKTMAETRRAEATLRSAQHAVEVAQSELDVARAALQVTAVTAPHNPQELLPVRAPVGGRVLKVPHKSEGVVNPGDPLVEIANARVLEVEVEVLSADAVRISPGGRVLFERWGGEQPLEGLVRRVEPVAFTKRSALGVEEQRVLVIVDFTSPETQWRRLGDGYRVEASFILWENPDVLRAPASAVFRHQNGWAVFVVEDGVSRRRAVEIRHRNGLFAEVLSGLKDGETVVVHPDNTIDDGKRVKPRSAGP